MNFATLQGLTIPEGVVTQIADASGRVLWMLSGGKVILQVEKITSDTYAGETTYTGEQFILLDIYPKTNGTVKVTYGGLTKTITDTSGAAEPNAQQVFFGTFNGVSDSVTTPASGELKIEGDCYAFGCGQYVAGSKRPSTFCTCVNAVVSFGNISIIPENAFGAMTKSGCPFETFVIPNTITRIGDRAFMNCTLLRTVTIGSEVSNIGSQAFDFLIGGSLTTVKMLGTTPPILEPYQDLDEQISYRNFGVASDESFKLQEIIVPAGCGDIYMAADGWSTYADYIVEES